MVQLLIDKGADVNAKNNEGQTALAFVTESTYGKIIQKLVAAGSEGYQMPNAINEVSLIISNNKRNNTFKDKFRHLFRWTHGSCRKALSSGHRLLGPGN